MIRAHHLLLLLPLCLLLPLLLLCLLQGPTTSTTSPHTWCCRTLGCPVWSTCHTMTDPRAGALYHFS